MTHDRVEAMRLGNRVAVLSHGQLIQGEDRLQGLYRNPRNPLVATHIWVRAMNVAKVTIENGEVLSGSSRPPLYLGRRPSLSAFGKIVLGLRLEQVLLLRSCHRGESFHDAIEVKSRQ